jgi:hypothetical protein
VDRRIVLFYKFYIGTGTLLCYSSWQNLKSNNTN